MELIDSGLSQKIMDRHANLPLFTTHFSPVLSTKRIIPRTRWLELVYALPFYMILRRNIVRSFSRTKNVLATAKRIGNIFVHYTKQDSSLPSGRSDFFAALFGYYSYNPLLFLSRKIAPVKPRGVSLLPHYLSATEPEEICESRPSSVFAISAVDNYTIPQNALYRPYGRLERETFHNAQNIISYFKSSSPPGLAQPVRDETSGMGTEAYSAAANYPVPVVSTLPPTVSHKPTVVSYKSLVPHYLSTTEPAETGESRPSSVFVISAVDNYTIPQNALYRPYGRLERYKTQAAYAPLHSTSDSFATLFSFYSHNPLLFLSRKIASVKPQGVSLVPHYLSTTEPAETGESRPSSVFATSADNTIPQNVLYRPYGRLERYKTQAAYAPLHSTSDSFATLFSFYSHNPLLFLSQKIASVKPQGVSLVPHYLSTTEPAETGESRPSSVFATSAVDNYTIPQNVLYRPYGRLERYKTQAAYAPLHSTSDSFATLFSFYSHNPLLFLSQKTAPVKPQGVSLVPHYLSTTEIGESRPSSVFVISADNTIPQNALYRPYGRLERESYILRSTNDFINFSSLNSMNNNQRQHTLEMEKAASIYHTHPEIEHVTTTRTEIIKERVIEKEEESKPPHAAPQLPSIDVNRLTDQIYQMMERKIRIEKERRGLYG
jgi:hypothetical protein